MIAVITGATGDIGEEFVKSLIDEVDLIWAVGRSEEKLDALRGRYGERIVPVICDLSDKDSVLNLCDRIEKVKPDIKYLVNNAGVARMAAFSDFSISEISDMLEINNTAVTLLCRAAIPFMGKGASILNIASASAFQPNPYIAVYSASKAYLLSLTRSLNVENRDINCIAVCPGWVDTKMLPEKTKSGKTIRYPGIVSAEKVVRTALKDCRKGRDVSVCSAYYRYTRFLSKVVPHNILMRMWVKGIEGYLK